MVWIHFDGQMWRFVHKMAACGGAHVFVSPDSDVDFPKRTIPTCFFFAFNAHMIASWNSPLR